MRAARSERIGGVVIHRADKAWWPPEGITKSDVARHYEDAWPRLRSWLRDRILTAERCPDGMRGRCFIQKDFPSADEPHGAPRFAIRAASTGKVVHYLVGGSFATVLGMVDLGAIAVHAMNSRRRSPRAADWMAFDLDPESGEFADAARAARLVRRVLDEVRLRSFVKTSGGRGVHVLVALRRGYAQHEVREAAFAIAHEVAAREPRRITVEASKTRRRGRVFVDVGRNSFGQTIAMPWSVRRRERAPVSTPLAWDELRPRTDPAGWNVRTVARRLAQEDPWAGFWRARHALPAT